MVAFWLAKRDTNSLSCDVKCVVQDIQVNMVCEHTPFDGLCFFLWAVSIWSRYLSTPLTNRSRVYSVLLGGHTALVWLLNAGLRRASWVNSFDVDRSTPLPCLLRALFGLLEHSLALWCPLKLCPFLMRPLSGAVICAKPSVLAQALLFGIEVGMLLVMLPLC